MNLGYLMVPRGGSAGGPARDTGRSKMARDLGVSEFYMVEPQDHTTATNVSTASAEQADVLRAVPKFPEHPVPQVVAINGQRQPLRIAANTLDLARPAVTPEQVRTNARARHATLSVSWLGKADLAQHWTAHVSGSTHAGFRARPEDWRIARTILVCNDAARAEALIKADDSPCRAYYAKVARPGTDIDALLDACVLYGSRDTVLDGLIEIMSATGPFGTLTLVDHDWSDDALARQSLATITSALVPVTQCNRTAT